MIHVSIISLTEVPIAALQYNKWRDHIGTKISEMEICHLYWFILILSYTFQFSHGLQPSNHQFQ